MAETTKPIEKVFVKGVSIAVWKQTGSKGDFCTFTIQKSWKDQKTEKWKNGNSFTTLDIDNMKTALDQIKEKIEKLK